MPTRFQTYLIGGAAVWAVTATTLEQHGWFEDRNLDMAMTSNVVTSTASIALSLVAFTPMQQNASDVEPNYGFSLREPGSDAKLVWIA